MGPIYVSGFLRICSLSDIFWYLESSEAGTEGGVATEAEVPSPTSTAVLIFGIGIDFFDLGIFSLGADTDVTICSVACVIGWMDICVGLVLIGLS